MDLTFAPMSDADGLLMDETWIAKVTTQAGGLGELLEMPPKSIRHKTEEYFISPRFLREPILLLLVVQLAEVSGCSECPTYVWQVIASQSTRPAHVLSGRVNSIVHDHFWQMYTSQHRRLMDPRREFPTSKALFHSFGSYNGSWSDNRQGWSVFMRTVRENLTRALIPDLTVELVFPWPLCMLCTSTADEENKAWKLFIKDNIQDLPCLENWIRRWHRNNNTLDYMSAFPKLQALSWAIKKQYTARMPIDRHAWMSHFAKAWPNAEPHHEILRAEPRERVPESLLKFLQ